jgi:hypothetical protein
MINETNIRRHSKLGIALMIISFLMGLGVSIWYVIDACVFYI